MKRLPSRSPRKTAIGILTALFVFVFGLLPLSAATGQEIKKEQEKGKPVRITEEIQVVGKAPKEQPIATVTRIDLTRIERNKPLDLAEAIRYAPGVTVTYGSKYEFTLKLRGMDSRRIALLIDGVPSYEPYYGSFDLKTVSAAGLDSLQITKGPSSVLYGPNTLAGIVNVITRRPGPDPYLSLTASYGERKTRSVGLDSGFQKGLFGVAGALAYQDSNGFAYPDPSTGDKTSWMNTDYKRFHLNAKAFYTPSPKTEIMLNGGIYTSNYGLPPALGVQKARYWRFKNWDRYTLNAGGFSALGESSTLRFRAFHVNYKNALDQYKDMAMTVRQFESAFDNSVYGAFALADLGLSSWNALKVSLNYQRDVARSQDDVGLPWVQYDQGTFSAAVENHLSLSERWKLIGGLSLDVIDKFSGGNASRLHPLLGVKFAPSDSLDLHLSVAQKSRFPNMRAMYSPSSGNPDLLSETGTNGELGFTWNEDVYVSGAVFVYQFRNMIDTMTLPDGTKRNWNVGSATINGLELQVQKSLGWLEGTLNYTWLDHRNETDDRPLDSLSAHSLNFEISLNPLSALRFSFFGLYASKSNWFDFNANKLLDIPSYFNLDAIASYTFDGFEVFLKATNLFNDYIYAEPIFPWRARFFEVGAKVKVF